MGSFFFVKKTGGCRQPGKIDSPLNKKLQEVKWGEFRLGDLFEIETGSILKSNELITGDIPRISVKTTDNGIIGYYNTLKNTNARHYSNFISVNFFGKVFYHPYTASLEMKVHVLKLKNKSFTSNTGIFIASSIQRVLEGKYSYGDQLSSTDLKTNDIFIQLPITSTGEIDFAFMEKFISELEEERISELSAYLEVTGLKDYTLTPEEENALKDFEEMEWGEFEIGELFHFLTSKKRFDANKVKILENGNYPYIVRTSLNNGTKGYLNENEEYLNSGNTISFGQDTATIFYQKEPYFTGDKIKIVKAKDDLFNAKNALYFLTSMNKSFQVYSWGSSSFNVDILSKEKMFLPLQNNSLNYPFMETFISAIQKLVIKDVVLYADKKINATKIITNNY